MAFDAILFDCDGTLVDSERLGAEILHQRLLARGLEMGFSEFRERFRGRKFAVLLEAMEEALGAPLPDDFVAGVRARQAEVFAQQLAPVEGIEDLLLALEAKGVPRCVASGAPLYKIEMVLEFTGLRRFFGQGHLYSSYALDMWKPHPDLFLHAAASLGVAPEGCAVVEDSLVGVQAGVAAGMQVFHYAPHPGIHTLQSPRVQLLQRIEQLIPWLGL